MVFVNQTSDIINLLLYQSCIRIRIDSMAAVWTPFQCQLNLMRGGAASRRILDKISPAED
jgi:hypothetical protein